MAALQLREDTTAGRLILQPPIASRLGNLIFSLIWLVGAGTFLLPMFFGGRIDWLAVMAFLIFAVVPVSSSFLNAISATTVTIDRGTRTVSSVRSLFFLPVASTTRGFNDLTKIEVQSISSSRAVNVWLVNVVSRDDKRIRVNWNGAQREMVELAQKVSTLTGVPVVQAEYALPTALQDVLKKIAPAARDQPQPAVSAPAPQSTEPTQTTTVLGRLLKELSDQSTATGEPPRDSTAPSPLPVNELAQPQESSVDSAPEVSAEDGKSVWNLSINQLEQRVAKDSLDADARYVLARRFHSRGDLDRAIESYRQVVRIDPTNPNAQNDLGVALQARGKRVDAETAYHRAIALDPFFSTAHLNLALLLRAMNRATEASQEFFLARQNARDKAERNAAEAASGGAKMEPQLSKV